MLLFVSMYEEAVAAHSLLLYTLPDFQTSFWVWSTDSFAYLYAHLMMINKQPLVM